MISLGHHLTTPADPLQKISVETVWHAIKSPNPETQALIRQLRIVRNINLKQYATLKRNLPYIVCGMFSPASRKMENFAYTEYFILDIDHITQKEMSLPQVRASIQQDSRVVMCFASPSEDGLKVMFRLSQRCHDAGVFSLFYKAFAQRFANQYGIQQVIDLKTCDVSRACFVSMDPEAYYNVQADSVNMADFVDTQNPFDFFSQVHQIQQEAQIQESTPQTPKSDIDDQVMANIKSILDPYSQKAKEKVPAYVPLQLQEIEEALKFFLERTGVVVSEIINIHYGKKIRTQVSHKTAETNVFYGKRGFSVVISPRTGTDPELNNVIAQLIESYFNQ